MQGANTNFVIQDLPPGAALDSGTATHGYKGTEAEHRGRDKHEGCMLLRQAARKDALHYYRTCT
jgi:hypothetical protein